MKKVLVTILFSVVLFAQDFTAYALVKELKSEMSLPQKVDDITTWTDVKAPSTNEVLYYYRVDLDSVNRNNNNVLNENNMPKYLTTLKSQVKKLLVRELCAQEDIVFLLQAGFMMSYHYSFDFQGRKISTYKTTITAQDCTN